MEIPGIVTFLGLYVPNSSEGLKRLDFRVDVWDRALTRHVVKLTAEGGGRPVLVGGDLNVAPDHVDVWNPHAPHIKKQAGCTTRERESFARSLSEHGRVDVFRALYPDATGHFSFWSRRSGGFIANQGLRLDHFTAPKEMVTGGGCGGVRVRDCWIHIEPQAIEVSDHAPIVCDVISTA